MQERNRGNQYPFTGAVWKAAGSCDPLCKERGSSVSTPESKIRDQRSSDVMWTTDDEIRDELAALAKQLPVQKTEDHWLERFRIVLQRVEDMIYKETNIFFPNCALNFTEEEWFGIYRDSKDYPVCFGVENATWEAAEKFLKEKSEAFVSKKIMGKKTDEIIMPGGHLTVAQLTAMLNTIPMEITFVDEDNINRFFNE